MNQYDYIEAGFRIFGLQGQINGKCECGNPQCKAILKHPRSSAWQHTPNWSDEQLEVMDSMGHFATGFGVLVDNHIVIDIDPRNGGNKSYTKLCKDTGIDFKKEAGFVVATGGGGWHIYYNRPAGVALVSHLKSYEGIDFKSSGYVVGSGSLHASGSMYEAEHGTPDDITDAPEALLKLLEKPEMRRSEFKGGHIDLADSDISEMLSNISPDIDHDSWVKVGMAIHDATGGTGFVLWDTWSSAGNTYPGSDTLQQRWHSFGKSAHPVTIGTLMHYAEQGGWQQSVTFETDLPPVEVGSISESDIDLLRPPGFVGQLVEWINGQCRFPRERLAVATALSSIGNIGGLRYQDATYGVTSNQFIFCVAGSATGKEAIQQAQSEIHRAAGISPATHGGIKSEQEIVRNLIDHQAAFYIIDEMGLVLQKIQNARKRGGAAYLEGVIGVLMSAYSKANSYMALSGDVKKEIKKQLLSELSQLNKLADAGQDVTQKLETLERQLVGIDNGLERPFLSLIGYTTPSTFASLVDYENSANGFFGRSLIVQERDTNPKAKKRFIRAPMNSQIKNSILSIATGGQSDTMSVRVEHHGERKEIPTTEDALEALDGIEDEFHTNAEAAKENALEAIPRRAFELVLKVSLILAIPEGVRTLEHVRWAYAFVKRDISEKINLIAGNMADQENRKDEALARQILALLDTENGEIMSVISQRCRAYKKEDVEQTIQNLISNGYIEQVEPEHSGRGRPPAPRFVSTGAL